MKFRNDSLMNRFNRFTPKTNRSRMIRSFDKRIVRERSTSKNVFYHFLIFDLKNLRNNPKIMVIVSQTNQLSHNKLATQMIHQNTDSSFTNESFISKTIQIINLIMKETRTKKLGIL